MIKKIINIIKINLKWFCIKLISYLVTYLFRFKKYIPGIDRIYIYTMFRIFDKSEIIKANELAKFLFNKKNENLITNDFISVILQHSGDKTIGREINNFNERGRYILRKINLSDQFILVDPGRLKKFGHAFFLDPFIKAIRLNLIDEKKIILTGNINQYHPIVSSLYSNCPEVEFDEKFFDKQENKKLKNCNNINWDSIRFKDGNFEEIHVFWNKINQKWNETKKNIVLNIDNENLKECINYFKNEKKIDIENDPFVLLHARNNISERYSDLRNSNIEDHREAVDFLIKKNIKVIRIGDKTMKEFKLSSNNYLDIKNDSNQERYISSLVFLSKFGLVSASGPLLTYVAFNKSYLATNYVQLKDVIGNEMDMIVPKMIFYKDGKIVKMKERFGEFFQNQSSIQYNRIGCKVKDNSPELIKSSTIEMYKKVILNEKIHLTENQKKYINISKENLLSPLVISQEVENEFPEFFSN